MPIRYVPYTPNTVEGQALLSTIARPVRVLSYRENNEVFNRIARGMPYYELERSETVGGESDNLLIRGECVSACAYLKEQGIKIDLVYIDPPFASGADYAKKVYLRRNPKKAAELEAAEQELDNDELRAFEETMYGDIWKKEDYLNWMYENLVAIKSVMSETAVIYLHLDHNIGFYAKVLMDEIFGEGNWLNTITWRSQVPRGKKVDAFYYSYSSQFIMVYSKNKDVGSTVWNRPKKELKISAQEAEKNYSKDEFGFFRTSDPGTYSFDKLVELNDLNRVYVSKGGKLIIDEESRTVKTTRGTIGIKYYLKKDGNNYIAERAVDNIWDDIPGLGTVPHEDLHYDTQKTEALLERIIKASSDEKRPNSDEKMVVADFFGGSGVTAKVANDLGRSFIHVDVGLNSIQTTRDRLKGAGASFHILDIKDGVSLFRNPQQTMDKLARLIPNLQRGVAGLPKFWFGAVQDSKLGTVPVYVPNLIDSQQKVLDVPAINWLINKELQELDESVKQVIVYYIDIDDQPGLETFIRENNATMVKVELRDLKNVLHDVVVEDSVDFTCTQTEERYTVRIDAFASDRLNQKLAEFNDKGQLQAIKKSQAFTPIAVSEEGLELIELVSLDCENGEGAWHSSSEIKIDKKGYVTKDGEKTRAFWDGTVRSEGRPLRLKVRSISGDETIWEVR